MVAEVAMPFDKRIPQRKGLCQPDHRIVHGGVAMRMVAAEHVSDRRRGFAERLVVGQLILIHRVEDAAVDRLKAVPHVGQRAADKDRTSHNRCTRS